MKAATAQAADAYWRLLGEMNRRYMGDLRALEAVVEQYKKPPLSAVRNGREMLLRRCLVICEACVASAVLVRGIDCAQVTWPVCHPPGTS